jgi:hypothetical protein
VKRPRGRNDPAWFEPYRELGYQEALARAEAEGRPVRVLLPGTFRFDDLVFDRLNLAIDADENLLDIYPG